MMKNYMRVLIITAMALLTTSAMADTTTIGATDCSSGWWVEFSDYYSIEPNKTITLEFDNFNKGEGENWHNWIAVLANGQERGMEGYSEYLAYRADNFGWGDAYTSTTCNYIWGNFMADMNGAHVKLTVARQEDKVTVHADVTTAVGVECFEETKATIGATDVVRLFLTVEQSYIVIDNDKTTITDSEKRQELFPEQEGTVIGELDNTTTWWSAFSDYFTMEPQSTLELEFYNYTNKATTYNNWLLGVTTNADRNDTENGYLEYFILRADNWCWGTYGNSQDNSDIYSIFSNYNWDTFTNDMNGAKVKITIDRTLNDYIYVTAEMTPADVETGITYAESLNCYAPNANEQTLRAFLTVEGGHLILQSSKVTVTGISEMVTRQAENGQLYNLNGMSMGKDNLPKGIYIQNGKKFVVK